MDSKHQYYLSNEFNQKMIRFLNNLSSKESSKKEIDKIFNLLYPAIINFVSIKKLKNPDIIADFLVEIYENFMDFLIKAKNFSTNKEDFVFYYYFIKYLYFQWQNFKRKKNSIKSNKINNEYEYLDKVKTDISLVATGDYHEIEQIKQIIKNCLYNHFETEEIVMFLVYYHFLLDEKDYIVISDFLKLPVLDLLDMLSFNLEFEDNEGFTRTMDENVIKSLFKIDINSFRVYITRIKKKMKIKCNYLLENYLFIDEG
ncbi:MAG: hypothetical protein ACK4YF_00800 [Exilispira sp.]